MAGTTGADVIGVAVAAGADQPRASERRALPRVEWLIDNADTYDAVLRAIARARRTIWIAQLALDPDCTVHRSRARGDSPRADDDRLILDALIAASTKGVRVCVLLNTSLLLDTAKPLQAWLARSGATGIEVRGISRFPQLLHAKMVLVDEEEAILLGSPFVNGYWDDTGHQPTDSRRPLRELGGRPLHDVSVLLTGPAVQDLGLIFAELWNDVALRAEHGSVLHPLARAETVDRDQQVHIVRTTPRHSLPRHPDGHMEILSAIESGLENARSLIYIEHQYLSARPVVAALARALERAASLEILLVLNQNPDVTAYRGWQNLLLREAGLLDHPRVGIFALWSAEPHRTWAVNQLFVHSKVLTIDDRWATVGSANLDGVSLHSYGDDFAGRLGRRVFRDVRNFDMNVVIAGRGSAPVETIRELRTRLWGEHLGAPVDRLASPPVEGWLHYWRRRAARNIAALNAPPGDSIAEALGTTFVLPYSTRSSPMKQLADIGVVTGSGRIDLRFDPGWLEIHCSPNWVRNMFT